MASADPAPGPAASPGVKALELNEQLFMALYGCELINQAGIMLQVSQVVIATAQVLFHKFYHKKQRTMKEFPPFHLAMACIYLSTKVEEEKRRHRDILNVFDRLNKKRTLPEGARIMVLDPHGRRYGQWKQQMMKFELLILSELGYMLSFEHPHKFILNYINVLEAGEEVAQKAWSYLNDLMRLPHILEWEKKPEVLACSAIFLAARNLQHKLPDNPPWYELFEATKPEMEKVAMMIMELYEIPKLHFENLKDEPNLDGALKRLDDMPTLPPLPPKQQQALARKKKLEAKKKAAAAAADDKAKAKESPTKPASKSRSQDAARPAAPAPAKPPSPAPKRSRSASGRRSPSTSLSVNSTPADPRPRSADAGGKERSRKRKRKYDDSSDDASVGAEPARSASREKRPKKKRRRKDGKRKKRSRSRDPTRKKRKKSKKGHRRR